MMRRYMCMALTALMMVWGAVQMMAQEEGDFTFNPGVRYSQWVTKARLNSFYANKVADGFAVYDANGNKVKNGNTRLDYVPGLVAKAIVENVQYYSQYDWAQSWTMPFFYSMADYCNNYFTWFTTTGGSLDNLNAAKVLFGLYELTNTGGTYASDAVAQQTKNNAQSALGKAMSGFKDHNNKYKIGAGTSACKAGHTIVEGGWWHKSQYQDEMWLDGSYMGPALFAQLRNYNGSDIIGDDWTIVYRQIQALWEMCWNPTDKLLYHAFAAEGHETYSKTWAGYNPAAGVYHSASYWGRAEGWFLLALVDILEQMDKITGSELARLSTDWSARTLSGTGTGTGTGNEEYNTLKAHLAEMCEGLAQWQDEETGCWYQLLDEDDTFYADKYNYKSFAKTYNYLESSASALFAAGIMKAIRLGYISEEDYGPVARKAYAGLVNTFMATDGKEGVHLYSSCRSAGLGTWSVRDGSKAYYLLGNDVVVVTKDEQQTEGKVLGAFILAATEYEKLYQDNTVLLEKDLAPKYDIKKGETIECTASGSGSAITYQWYRNGVAIEGETDSEIAPQQPGNYYCTATADGKMVHSSIANVTVDGKEDATGIINVNHNHNLNHNLNSNCQLSTVNCQFDTNLAGQRVGSGYRGMRVQKGRKMVE